MKVRACLGLGEITIEHFRIGGYSQEEGFEARLWKSLRKQRVV